MRGRTRLALGRCHVRQAADAGSGVGQLLEYEVRFSQVLARRQRRQRRRQRRLRWRRERRLPSGSARPRDITGDQKIECWLNVLGLGIPREMRDLSCSKPKNFPACRRLSEVRGRAVHAVREGAPQPPWVPLTADPATDVACFPEARALCKVERKPLSYVFHSYTQKLIVAAAPVMQLVKHHFPVSSLAVFGQPHLPLFPCVSKCCVRASE